MPTKKSAKPATEPTPDRALLARLDKRAAELESEIAVKEQRQPAHNEQHEVVDRGEQANTKVRAEVRGAEIERDRTELRQIALARERIEAGTYTECVDCGKTIDAGRLEAQPTAQRCIACQEKAETAERRAQ